MGYMYGIESCQAEYYSKENKKLNEWYFVSLTLVVIW